MLSLVLHYFVSKFKTGAAFPKKMFMFGFIFVP